MVALQPSGDNIFTGFFLFQDRKIVQVMTTKVVTTGLNVLY